MSLVKKHIIYFLRGPEKTDFYIGSSSLSLAKRLANHRYKAFMEERNSKLYRRMRESPEEFIILPLEALMCTEEEAKESEQRHIDILKPSLNTYRIYSFERRPRLSAAPNKRRI